MSESSPVRAALIGAGSWARAAHLPALLRNPMVELVAVCDADPAACERAIGAREGIATCDDATSMLASHSLDLVCIVTPDDQHVQPIRAAVAAGVHVICEKPLALSGAQAWELTRMAEEAGLVNRVGFTVRYAPALLAAKDLIANGVIGEPHLLIGLQQNGQFLDPSQPFHWKMDRARTGGGAIVEYGVHTLDAALWLAGPALRAQAIGQTLVGERPISDGSAMRPVRVDDSTGWLIEFANGGKGIGHAGWSTPGRAPGIEMRVYGSGGALRVELSDEHPSDQALWVSGPDGILTPVELPMPDPRPWYEAWIGALIDDAVNEILGRTHRGDPSFADGARAQDLLDAMLRSMESGRLELVSLPA